MALSVILDSYLEFESQERETTKFIQIIPNLLRQVLVENDTS